MVLKDNLYRIYARFAKIELRPHHQQQTGRDTPTHGLASFRTKRRFID